MKNEKVFINENGEEIKIEIVFSFRLEELNKNYIAYTINDDDSLPTALIFISELDPNTNQIISIKEEEKEMVMTAYEEFKKGVFEE
ncbi:MAG: DUF1292 domain-containing protein [Bacilli bacterium]|jgi:uncharacterized protein YrzB (UPF0473 family)|nr:DUF1292 domain-containing protein [Bacilli bacterium]